MLILGLSRKPRLQCYDVSGGVSGDANLCFG